MKQKAKSHTAKTVGGKENMNITSTSFWDFNRERSKARTGN